jgi:hypothetical protein
MGFLCMPIKDEINVTINSVIRSKINAMFAQSYFRANIISCMSLSLGLCLGLPALSRADLLQDHYTVTSKKINGFRGTPSIVRAKDGGMMLAGIGFVFYENPGSTGSFAYGLILMKLDSLGEEQWHREYPSDTSKSIQKMAPAADGGFVITGSAYSYGDWVDTVQPYIQKFDSLGNVEWCKIFSLRSRSSTGLAVEPSHDGGFLVVGETLNDSSFSYNAFIIKVESKGEILWTRVEVKRGDNIFKDIRELPDGNLIILGEFMQYGPPPPPEGGFWDTENIVHIYKTDSKGHTLFSRNYPSEETKHPLRVDLTRDKGLLVSSTKGIGKTDSLGIPIWTRSFPFSDAQYSALETTEGTHIAWGNLGHDFTGTPIYPFIAGLDDTGMTQWTYSFGIADDMQVLPAPGGAYDILARIGKWDADSVMIYHFTPNLQVKDSISCRPGTLASLTFSIHNPNSDPMRYELVGKIRKPDGTWIPKAPEVFLNPMNLTVLPGETFSTEISHRIPDDAVLGSRYLYYARVQNRATDHPMLRKVTIDIK